VTERKLLTRTAEIAADYLESLDTRGVGPTQTYGEMHAALDAPVPDGPSDATAVIEELASLEPGITAMGSGRYFGFVIGGEAWMSGTIWEGRAAIRLSVSGWRTTTEDVDRTVAAFARALA